MTAWIAYLDRLVWGGGLIFLLLLTGVCMTGATRGIQWRRLGLALRYMVHNEAEGTGEVGSFAALCMALSATIGTGNIIGTATAVTLGGPGALFWMLISAVLGMATKYAEGFLAVRFRYEQDGHTSGGPFAYIRLGMGERWKPLAAAFALFGMLAGLLGIGTVTQVNGITAAAERVLDPARQHIAFSVAGEEYTWVTVVTGLMVTALTAAVLAGGVRRIAGVSSVLVPLMSILYVGCTLWILIRYCRALPGCIGLVLQGAFAPQAVLGAGAGVTLRTVMRLGVGRGIFSNEAGLGSAPIAAAAAKSHDPVRQGLVTMTGTFVDTVVLCTLTGLTLLVTDAWQFPAAEGFGVSALAWEWGLPLPSSVSGALLSVCLIFFAFTSIIGWHYYAQRCFAYLFGEKRLSLFRWLYVLAVGIGPFLPVGFVWDLAELCNGLMAFPNLIALLALMPVVRRETRQWEKSKKTGG